MLSKNTESRRNFHYKFYLTILMIYVIMQLSDVLKSIIILPSVKLQLIARGVYIKYDQRFTYFHNVRLQIVPVRSYQVGIIVLNSFLDDYKYDFKNWPIRG